MAYRSSHNLFSIHLSDCCIQAHFTAGSILKQKKLRSVLRRWIPGLTDLRSHNFPTFTSQDSTDTMKHLEYAMEKLNSFRPDLIINTGDFVTFGWREFDRCDTILSKSRGIYGNFAVFGNHDMGVYYPGASDEDKEAIVMKMNELITASGYRVLNDEHVMVNIKGVKVAMIGVKTSGSHPHIIHGDLNKAIEGIDSADFKILLFHDPNQWDEDVVGKTDIDLSFAGHTHGGQFGILTKKFRWSPVKYFYPQMVRAIHRR